MLDLDCSVDLEPESNREFLHDLPARPGVLRVDMRETAAEPFLVKTADVRRAAERLLGPADPSSRRLNLRDVAARMWYRITGSKFEQSLTHYQQARSLFPKRYREIARIRPPAVLKVNLRSEYPRCYVTRRIRAGDGLYFGPFDTRKTADAFGEAFLDLFKLRRCQIKIRRDPAYPGCIYSEMKMCLSPCFAGCTKEEYSAEVGRVLETLATSGSWLVQAMERERESASEDLDFEHAAELHKRIERVAGIFHNLPNLTKKVDDLNLAILQRGAEAETVVVFPVLEGMLQDPIFLRFAELSSEPKSVESILRARLDITVSRDAVDPVGTVDAGGVLLERNVQSHDDWKTRFGLKEAGPELSEHLSLIARWFYSKPRDGEIFFREGDWPYRRILRACSRFLTPVGPDGYSLPRPSAEQAAALTRERIKRLKAFSKPPRKPGT